MDRVLDKPTELTVKKGRSTIDEIQEQQPALKCVPPEKEILRWKDFIKSLKPSAHSPDGFFPYFQDVFQYEHRSWVHPFFLLFLKQGLISI